MLKFTSEDPLGYKSFDPSKLCKSLCFVSTVEKNRFNYGPLEKNIVYTNWGFRCCFLLEGIKPHVHVNIHSFQPSIIWHNNYISTYFEENLGEDLFRLFVGRKYNIFLKFLGST